MSGLKERYTWSLPLDCLKFGKVRVAETEGDMGRGWYENLGLRNYRLSRPARIPSSQPGPMGDPQDAALPWRTSQRKRNMQQRSGGWHVTEDFG